MTLASNRLTAATAVLTVLALACGDETTSTGANPTGPGPTTTTGQGGNTSTGGSMSTSTSMGGSQGGAGAGGNGTGGNAFAVCDNPPANYPAGPYGNEEGDTFELLEMQGWTNTNPTQRIDLETPGAFSMDDIRAAHPNSFVMLHLAAMF